MSSQETIEAWARDCAKALSRGCKPKPLLPGRKLTKEEAELAHKLLKENLASVGIDIEEHKEQLALPKPHQRRRWWWPWSKQEH